LCFGAGFSFAQPNLPSTHFDLSRFLVEPSKRLNRFFKYEAIAN